jgi:hypothetical protein
MELAALVKRATIGATAELPTIESFLTNILVQGRL